MLLLMGDVGPSLRVIFPSDRVLLLREGRIVFDPVLVPGLLDYKHVGHDACRYDLINELLGYCRRWGQIYDNIIEEIRRND